MVEGALLGKPFVDDELEDAVVEEGEGGAGGGVRGDGRKGGGVGEVEAGVGEEGGGDAGLERGRGEGDGDRGVEEGGEEEEGEEEGGRKGGGGEPVHGSTPMVDMDFHSIEV